MKIFSLATFVIAAALTLSGTANATISLTNEYSVTSFASDLGANQWKFDYAVTNNNQGNGDYTGLDGFTIFIPQSAVVVTSTSPAPYNGAPGFWYSFVGNGLNLAGNNSQNLSTPAGYNSFTWWGADPHSVYALGSTAYFSITLGNVSAGTNTIGLTTYFGSMTPAQEYTTNQWGNYSTITTNLTSPVATVPEPETYAMLLAGIGLIGGIARRHKQK
jgi:hypothetical protein